jgi:hypothetical protein
MQVTKRCVVLIAIALAIVCVPAMAARVSVAPITHVALPVFQAYAGNSGASDVSFLGYAGTGDDVITAVPGVFNIVPGKAWANFVGAANDFSEINPGGPWIVNDVPAYTIKNVVLTKQTPSFIQCNLVYAPKRVVQQGTASIRTWWPLMYEAPGTTWTLNILYGTPQTTSGSYDDDGPGPNPQSVVHQETWTWKVDATFGSMKSLLALFHEIPFGLDEVPIISDEVLYGTLQGLLDEVVSSFEANDIPQASQYLAQFELEVADGCIGTSPTSPSPSGPGTGIAQTNENPACCKLLVDVEYVSSAIFVAKH